MGCGNVATLADPTHIFKGNRNQLAKAIYNPGGDVIDTLKGQGAGSESNVASVASQLDPADLGTKSLLAQLQLAPDVYAANAKYQPKYADLSNEVLRRQLLGEDGKGGIMSIYSDISPTLSKWQADENTATRTADINDVKNLGKDAVAAWRAANPELQATMKTLQDKIDAQSGSTGLQTTLRQQATDELANGGKLSGEAMRLAQQTARTASADRGMALSNSSIFDEAMNSEKLRTERLDKARAFAMGVDQNDFERGQTTVGNYSNLANMWNAQSQDPYSLVLGRSTTPQLAQSTVSQGQTLGTSPTMFDPYSSDIMSIYNANYNAQNAANIAAGNNSAASNSAMLGAGASVAGAAIIAL